eukprot:jgi/Mesvir1/18086/Mv09387-RA.1
MSFVELPLSGEEVTRRVNESFDIFDGDSKGWLTRHELKCAIASLCGMKPSRTEVDFITSHSPDGQTSRAVFLSYMHDKLRHSDMDENIRRIFKAFDARSAGFITVDNLTSACRESGVKWVPEHVIDAIFDEVDMDKDGRASILPCFEVDTLFAYMKAQFPFGTSLNAIKCCGCQVPGRTMPQPGRLLGDTHINEATVKLELKGFKNQMISMRQPPQASANLFEVAWQGSLVLASIVLEMPNNAQAIL